MSSYLGHAQAFLSSLETQPFRPTETTADPLQLDSLASHMLGDRTQGRHGRGEAEPRWAERSTKGGEDWDVLRDVGGMGMEKRDLLPFQLIFSTLCFTDHSNR